MHIHTSWSRLLDQMHTLNNFKVHRLVMTSNSSVQIHGFSDASEEAYGACVYIRSTDQHGQHSSRLLCSKSRVAPLKTITLPRLELCGALLLAQLMNKVLTSMRMKSNQVYFWTDSIIVLHWIKAVDKKWKVFVANRVNEILRLSQAVNWHHVKTEFNPADQISRGMLPTSLIASKLWWHGPSWLCKDSQLWQISILEASLQEVPEQRQSNVSMVIINDDYDFLHKYSSLSRLVRVIAFCMRFINNIKINPLTPKRREF